MSERMGSAPAGRIVEKEIFIGARPERVFRALTDPEELGRWFGVGAAVDLRPGGALTFIWTEGQEEGVVVAVEPPRRFAFRWGTARVTTVEFALEPRDGGTLLRLTETGFGEGDDWDRAYRDNDDGWAEELGHLKSWVERA